MAGGGRDCDDDDVREWRKMASLRWQRCVQVEEDGEERRVRAGGQQGGGGDSACEGRSRGGERGGAQREEGEKSIVCPVQPQLMAVKLKGSGMAQLNS
ncbi:hypothetical protein OsJ_09078 [Oryza sativa Japonica Group]|uniref:Uncharacterized protein n=1 Tax=Oryza sativa subsp. japonica TaxID=39947 RepID=B9FAB1_ORYSJ|nr:hypothetical protein OsJ_09078 [Oryza sativa Japonica Group]